MGRDPVLHLTKLSTKSNVFLDNNSFFSGDLLVVGIGGRMVGREIM